MDTPMLLDGLNSIWMADFSIADKTHTQGTRSDGPHGGLLATGLPCLFVNDQAHPPSRAPQVPIPETDQFWVTPYSPPATGMLCL